jgi:prevent-host-death family protein
VKVELVTTLKRQATRLLKEVREDQEPILITEHGRPSAYLIDVESFEREKEKLKLFEGLARGEEAIRRGRSLSQQQAKERLAKWLK